MRPGNRSFRLVFLVAALSCAPAGAQELDLRLNEAVKPPRWEVGGIPRTVLQELGKGKWDRDQWNELFRVVVMSDSNKAKPIPILGEHIVIEGKLTFTPRFPLQDGLRYQARFESTKLPSKPTRGILTLESYRPRQERAPSTVLQSVYPSRDILPENQLKFYFHFSAPMSRGEAYRRIHLLDERGQEVVAPFLELDEEFWDPLGRRFTLLIDPGRIKRGLKPREDIGPALQEGKRYTLIVDAAWADATGTPLRQPFRKQFRVGPPDETQPELSKWKLTSPTAGTVAPLTLDFPESLDHALLGRMLAVHKAGQAQALDGTIRISREETLWQFTPGDIWIPGDYEIVIDSALEDLAGNSPAKPFEVDESRPIEKVSKPQYIRLPFRVEKAPGKR